MRRSALVLVALGTLLALAHTALAHYRPHSRHYRPYRIDCIHVDEESTGDGSPCLTSRECGEVSARSIPLTARPSLSEAQSGQLAGDGCRNEPPMRKVLGAQLWMRMQDADHQRAARCGRRP